MSEPQCTAPVRGHQSPAAERACPRCGPRRRAREHAQERVARTRTTAQQRRELAAAQQQCRHTQQRLAEHGITVITVPNDLMVLYAVSQDLRAKARRRGHFHWTHWLCQLLADTADTVDPAIYAQLVADAYTATLIDSGTKPWLAKAAGETIKQLTSTAFTNLLPQVQISVGLRALALLVCPNPNRCPAKRQLEPAAMQAVIQQ